jgi:hypothetical protein
MLEIHELLDRFQLLYPANNKLSDLRRSYVDQDLSSIFRLMPAVISGETEDLRKAVLEKNLHSVFRLANDEELRKLVLEDNVWKLWPVLERYTDTHFVSAFKSLFVNNVFYDKDCFSRGQLYSKIWLINELKKLNLNLGTVFLCAGWYATLAVMLFESGVKIEKIRSFDIDPSTVDIAETFNKPWVVDRWQFKATAEDILNVNYDLHTYTVRRSDSSFCSLSDSPDTIINTSCEHITNFEQWYSMIPKDKLLILQSNNYFEVAEHVNCSESLDKFDKMCPMSNTLFTGELSLPKYDRFMKIGFK